MIVGYTRVRSFVPIPMQEGPFPTFPAYPRHSSRKARAFLLVALFIVFIGVTIVLGNMFLSSSQKKGIEAIVTKSTPTPIQATPTASTAVTTTPTPTEAELDKGELSVQVLNGSGTSGAASELADVLKEAGYTVSSTGNADRFDYEETVIQLKKSQQGYGSLLRKDLSSSYTVAAEVETLAESARYDAIVIVGAK